MVKGFIQVTKKNVFSSQILLLQILIREMYKMSNKAIKNFRV